MKKPVFGSAFTSFWLSIVHWLFCTSITLRMISYSQPSHELMKMVEAGVLEEEKGRPDRGDSPQESMMIDESSLMMWGGVERQKDSNGRVLGHIWERVRRKSPGGREVGGSKQWTNKLQNFDIWGEIQALDNSLVCIEFWHKFLLNLNEFPFP